MYIFGCFSGIFCLWDFCIRSGPPQLGVVLVFLSLIISKAFLLLCDDCIIDHLVLLWAKIIGDYFENTEWLFSTRFLFYFSDKISFLFFRVSILPPEPKTFGFPEVLQIVGTEKGFMYCTWRYLKNCWKAANFEKNKSFKEEVAPQLGLPTASSPDITPLDFFLWGYVKDRIQSSRSNFSSISSLYQHTYFLPICLYIFHQVRASALIRAGSLKMQKESSEANLSYFQKAETVAPNNSDVFHHHGQVSFIGKTQVWTVLGLLSYFHEIKNGSDYLGQLSRLA